MRLREKLSWATIGGLATTLVVMLLPLGLGTTVTLTTFGPVVPPSGPLFLYGSGSTTIGTPWTSTAPGVVNVGDSISASAGPTTGGGGYAADFTFSLCAPTTCASTFTPTFTPASISVNVGGTFMASDLQMAVDCNAAGSSAISVASVVFEDRITDLTAGTSASWGGIPVAPVGFTWTGPAPPRPTLNYSSYPTVGVAPDWSIWCGGTSGTATANSLAASGNGNWTHVNYPFTIGHTYLIQFQFVLVVVAEVFNAPGGGTTSSASVTVANPPDYAQAASPVTIW